MELMDEAHLAWHLSGGTTELLLIEPKDRNVLCTKIGGTTDISAGQLIDRTGQLWGLPFPSGKHLDAIWQDAENKDVFRVKCPELQFSLSGVQNKVMQYYANCDNKAETAAYTLRCICYAVHTATKNALKLYPDLPVVFSGGVASNAMLREYMKPLKPVFSDTQYARDNAMGIAVLTHRFMEGI